MHCPHSMHTAIGLIGHLHQRRVPNTGFTPLPPSSQPYADVLFINAQAPSAHLFEAANQRMAALADLLRILESCSDGILAQETARLASALGLLLADAQALHEAAYQRSREEECAATPESTSPSEAPA